MSKNVLFNNYNKNPNSINSCLGLCSVSAPEQTDRKQLLKLELTRCGTTFHSAQVRGWTAGGRADSLLNRRHADICQGWRPVCWRHLKKGQSRFTVQDWTMSRCCCCWQKDLNNMFLLLKRASLLYHIYSLSGTLPVPLGIGMLSPAAPFEMNNYHITMMILCFSAVTTELLLFLRLQSSSVHPQHWHEKWFGFSDISKPMTDIKSNYNNHIERASLLTNDFALLQVILRHQH